MKYLAKVIVKLKPDVRDNQGIALSTVLKRKKIEEEAKMKTGKYFETFITAENEELAMKKIRLLCDEILSNPVLEEYKVIGLDKQ